MKRITIIVIVAFFLLQTFAFADDIVIESITFNNQEIQLSHEIITQGQTILVPMREIFEALGAEVYWFDARQEIVAYRNNMFIKLTIDSDQGFKNGKSFSLDQAPFIVDGTTYVPLAFITEAFDFVLTIDQENLQAKISSKDIPYDYRYINSKYMLRHHISPWGVEVSLPLHWYSIDNDVTKYGYDSDNLKYLLSLKKLPLKLDIPIASLASIYMGQIESESTLDLTILSEEDKDINGLSYYIINYEFENEEDITEHFIYFLYVDGDAYIADFSYGLDTTREKSITLFDEIMSTFSIYHSTVDLREEHYFESLEFNQLDMHVFNDLYANMTSDSSIPLQGKFNHFTSYDGLIAKVTHNTSDEEEFFFIPIEDSVFNGRIHLTHGLGKHNVTIYGASLKKELPNLEEETLNADENILLREKVQNYSRKLDDRYVLSPLLQISVVNLSMNDNSYLFPTPYLDIEDIQVNSNANLFSYKAHSTYSKAKSLYSFILGNFTIEEYKPESMQASSYTVQNRIGDPLEVTAAYVAMLRSINIPSRIVYGESDNIPYYWAEVYYNGSWYVVDLLASFDTGSLDFFHQSFTKYREIYSNIVILPL